MRFISLGSFSDLNICLPNFVFFVIFVDWIFAG